MELKRKENWEVALYDRVAEWQARDFDYGEADCCAFCGDCVEAMTGVNPWADWAGEYKDAKSAAALIRERGHKSLFFVLQSIFGKPVSIFMAQRGDIVFADLGLDAPQIGICLGEKSISCAPDGKSLVAVPTLELKKAFRV